MQEVILHGSTYNGLQVSLELKRNDRWHYLSVGYNHSRLDSFYGTAIEDDVGDAVRALAVSQGEETARYAASHREHGRKLFEIEVFG